VAKGGGDGFDSVLQIEVDLIELVDALELVNRGSEAAQNAD
jgi:hypothetical protein